MPMSSARLSARCCRVSCAGRLQTTIIPLHICQIYEKFKTWESGSSAVVLSGVGRHGLPTSRAMLAQVFPFIIGSFSI